MNKFIKAIAVFCIICLLATAAPASFAASESSNDNHLLYGRKQLQKSSESNYLTEAYDRIVEGVANRESVIVLSDLALTRDELKHVVTLYRNDPHPHFWLGNSYSFSGYSDGTIYSFNPGYNDLGTVSDEEFEKEVANFNNEVNAILNKAGIRNGMSQYDIELRLHDTLVRELDYIIDAPNAHNAYGALVENQAVCQGYTLAFNYLLRLCGIEAHYVAGYSRDIPHAWSLVLIDGHYYYTDITWDDPIGTHPSCNETFHAYFNISYNTISRDHTFNAIDYELPACDNESGSYFAHNPERIMTAQPDVALVASFFNNGSASVCVPEEYVDSFTEWYSANISELATLAGFDLTQPTTYLYTHSNDEYHLIIEGTLIVPEEPDITVLLGDVDGDGKVSSMDSNILRRIIAGSMIPSEENILGGDMDQDGRLTGLDSNLLKRHIAGN